jgi:hypothetical protein
MKDNLQALPLEALDWSGNRSASIDTLAIQLRQQCQKAIDWYVAAKIPKKQGATWLRALIILFTSLAGLLAVLAPIRDDPALDFYVHPAWISVAAALAAALLGLDRFLGFSRGWIRYIQTELELRTALNAFNLGWHRRRSEWPNGVPSDTQLDDAFKAIAEFLGVIDGVVKEETEQWVADFQASMQELTAANEAAKQAAKAIEEAAEEREKARAAAAAEARPGGLNLTVSNGDTADDGWLLEVGDRPPRKCSGTTGAVAGVGPGLVLVSISGSTNGRKLRAERSVAIAPGEIAECTLSLA